MYKIHLIYKDPWMECDTHFLFVRQIALLEKSQMVRSMLKNDDIEKQVEKYIGCVLHVPRSIVNFVMREKALHALLLGLHLSCMWSCPNLELGSSISVWFSRLSHAKSWTCKHAHNTPIHIFPNHSHNTHTWRFSNYINNHSLPLFPCSFSHRRSNIMSPASKRCVSLSFFSLFTTISPHSHVLLQNKTSGWLMLTIMIIASFFSFIWCAFLFTAMMTCHIFLLSLLLMNVFQTRHGNHHYHHHLHHNNLHHPHHLIL